MFQTLISCLRGPVDFIVKKEATEREGSIASESLDRSRMRRRSRWARLNWLNTLCASLKRSRRTHIPRGASTGLASRVRLAREREREGGNKIWKNKPPGVNGSLKGRGAAGQYYQYYGTVPFPHRPDARNCGQGSIATAFFVFVSLVGKL